MMMMIILSVVLGCVSSRSGPYIIFPRPYAPLAITNPEKVFLRCGGHPDAVASLYYCVSQEHLGQLKTFILRMDSLVRKYEYQTEVINE